VPTNNAREEEEARVLLKNYREHLVKAKPEKLLQQKYEISRTTEKISRPSIL